MDEPTPRLTFIRKLDERFDPRQDHARAADAGAETRVSWGVYASVNDWRAATDDQQYLLRIAAIAGTRNSRPVFSHYSAAAIHGLPIVGRWPMEVHTTVGPTVGGRSRNGVVKHHAKLPAEDVVEVGGFLVTSVARTVIDLAMTMSFRDAVIAADRALLVDRFGRVGPMTTKQEVQATLERLMPVRAHKRCQRVIDFGVHLSGSTLESTSRVSMFLGHCPRPELQLSYYDYQGFIGDSDFSWPKYGTLGEADGAAKYFDPRYRSGRTPEQVINDERIRHNRLVALPRVVIRWGWDIGTSPTRMRAHLANGGLPVDVPWL